jgi:octaprenyl-diphosphate synthase
MHVHDLHPALPSWLHSVDDQLTATFADEEGVLHDAGLNLVGSPGKRLRPVVLLLAGACFSEVSERLIRHAAIVELIHAASLVHDDIIDEARERRGEVSAPVQWGTKLAVLLGDFLFARVFELAALEHNPTVLRLLSRTATAMGRAVILEVSALTLDANEAVYWDVVHGKTAALFGTAAAIGACVSEAPPAALEALARFGEAFGTAFQLADDLLDLEGHAHPRGKPLGADWAQRRATLPLLHARQAAPPAAACALQAIWMRETPSVDDLGALQELIATWGGFNHGWRQVQHFREAAAACLTALPDSPALTALTQLCQDSFPLPVMPMPAR